MGCACVDEFYAPESMTSDGGCAYYDVVLADISDRQTREQYLRFFRDLRLTSPQTKLILLSADPLAALDVFECDPDYFVCKLEMETRLSAALRFVLRPCGGELGPCLIVGSRATRHVLSMEVQIVSFLAMLPQNYLAGGFQHGVHILDAHIRNPVNVNFRIQHETLEIPVANQLRQQPVVELACS